MAAPSTPVIQGVSPVYPFGSNVHATWVTDTSVTSGATTLYSGSTVVSTQAASLFDTTATTKTWKVSYPIAATGTYAIGVTATNGDGTSDEATAQFVVADYSGIVLSPSGTVTGLPINVAWSIDDPNGVATQNIVIEKSDHSRVLYSSVLQPTQRTLALGSAELAGIEDGAIYVILLHVTNGVGLVTTATSTITTSWASPVTPTATVTTDPDTLAASVTVTAGEATSATNVGEFFAHSLTDSSYWYSTNFSAAMTVLTDGWARFTYANSTSDWAWVNVSPKAAAVSLTASTAYTYLVEVKNITGSIRVNAPATHSTSSVWAESRNSDFSADGIAHVSATTKADIASVTQVRTYLAVPANSTVTCDIRLSLYAGEYNGPYVPYDPPATDTLMVVRVNPDGTRHVLAGDLESGDTVTDPLPPLGVEYAYEVTGIAATGVPSAPATVTHTNVTTCWAMNFGTGAAEVVLARFNPKASYSVEQGGELYHFADGGEGDGLPVWYGTTDRDINGSDTWDTLTHATADRLDALMRRYPVGWLRDPFGHRWRARMKPKFSHGIGKLWQVSIDWDAVRWVEA